MKKWLIAAMTLLLLTGCGAVDQPGKIVLPEKQELVEVDLMPGASPETSALALFSYDGETVTREFLFDTAAVSEVLADFHSAKVRPVPMGTTAMKPPYYGLEIGGEDGFSVCGLWSEGIFLTGSGDSYLFDYDFSAIQRDWSWELPDTFVDPALLPCAEYAARTEIGWRYDFLLPVKEQPTPEGIAVETVSVTDDEIVVRYTNRSGSEWSYGLSTQVQVLHDGMWYGVPMHRNYAFPSIAMVVLDGESREETFSLKPFGSLPAGTYRLVANSLVSEFTVE